MIAQWEMYLEFIANSFGASNIEVCIGWFTANANYSLVFYVLNEP